MFQRFFRWLKGVVGKLIRPDTFRQHHIDVATSDVMIAAIDRWMAMYQGDAPWLKHSDISLGLPAKIAQEIARMVTLEFSVTVTGSGRADWLSGQIQPVSDDLRRSVEYACAGGGLVFKPYVDGTDIAVDCVLANDFYPTSFNSRKEITGAVFVERKNVGKKQYTRLEYHQIDTQPASDGKRSTGRYIIQNKAFVGEGDNDCSREVALTDVDEWASLEPITTIENVDFPLFGYLRIPLGNTVDPKSPIGVSVYEKATKNIREADLQYQRLLWEYEGGEMAIDAVEDAFITDPKTNEVRLPAGKERLFRPNLLDPKTLNAESLFKTFAPTLRDSNYGNGLNKLLQLVEDDCGISRGTFSDPEKDARTATEIKTQKQRTYSTVTDIQKATQTALDALLRAMDALCTLYKMQPAGTYSAAYLWDDSIVVDSDAERMSDLNDVRNGLMRKWEYRMKWYGEDEKTAKAVIAEIAAADESDDALMGFANTQQEG